MKKYFILLEKCKLYKDVQNGELILIKNYFNIKNFIFISIHVYYPSCIKIFKIESYYKMKIILSYWTNSKLYKDVKNGELL